MHTPVLMNNCLIKMQAGGCGLCRIPGELPACGAAVGCGPA